MRYEILNVGNVLDVTYRAEPFLRSYQLDSHSGSSQPKVHHRVHKSPPLVPVPSQIDPVHTIPSLDITAVKELNLFYCCS
jgi:hypothetical protein